ncbi:MAG TPA: M1 family metallopeptidase [Vicinamibacterales bacterium]|nr:M1 family metallopeptidase [Vicinamibacterales bacterium]
MGRSQPLPATRVLVAAAMLLLAPAHAQRARPAAAAGAPPNDRQATEARQAPASSRPPRAAVSPRNANYSIDVRLDHQRRTLTGREVLTWRNLTSSPTSELRFHLYYNAWKNTRSTWLRQGLMTGGRRPLAALDENDWGWVEVTAVRLVGAGGAPPIDLTAGRHYISPDDGNADDQTVLAVPLPRPAPPGETLNVEIQWTSKVPRTFARTGTVGDYYFLAQWFPKVAVLQDGGWNSHQFHRGTEFFSNYGVYDVRLTVPTGWVVGATGRVQEVREQPDGMTMHRYYQEDVHDFAWTTSPDYLVREAPFEHEGLPPVAMRLLLQPEHEGQADRHFEATRAALRYYGTWYGPYPYGHITIVDPAWQSGAGGMEYPTLFTSGTRWLAPRAVASPEGVTVHEAGHQFWYGLVGNNEFEDAWLDEGLNTFSTGRTMEQAFNPNYTGMRFFGGFIPWVYYDLPVARPTGENGWASYRRGAELDVQATPSWRYWPSAGGPLSYSKTALWLHTLERHLGWPTLQRAMATFFQRWRFGHPKPADFFAVVNEVSGRDMTWFFDQVYRSSNTFDYAVDLLQSSPATDAGFFDQDGKRQHSARAGREGRYRTTVAVRRHGEAIFPVDVLVTFDNGETVREQWDGRDRWRLYTYERATRGVSAEVDPDRVLLLDVNFTNNSQTLAPRTAEATRKWTTIWLGWLQDALLTFAFLV